MFTLRMFDVLSLVPLNKSMLKCLLSSFLSDNQSEVFEEFFFEIFALDFLQIKISFQAVIQLLLCRKKLVRDLNNWIIVSKTVWIQIWTETVWDKTLKVVLDVENKLLLEKWLLKQKGFNQKDVYEFSNAKHESNLG